MIIYSVTHWRPRGSHREWPLVDEKHIGFFATVREAHAAVRALRLDPGFRRFLDGFRITEVTVGEDLWPTGFDPRADRDLVSGTSLSEPTVSRETSSGLRMGDEPVHSHGRKRPVAVDPAAHRARLG